MRNPYFFEGRERELRGLIDHHINDNLNQAACAGADPVVYHPDKGRPGELSLLRCAGCAARLACLALALRAEAPDAREGWYGGLGPADRDNIAPALQIDTSQQPPPDRAVEAARLRVAGWTINQIAAVLGCSRRTVQRYLRAAA